MTERSEVIIWLSPPGQGASSLHDHPVAPRRPDEPGPSEEAS
jgi:hypothetical protein